MDKGEKKGKRLLQSMHTNACQTLNDHGSGLRLYVGHALAAFDV